MAPLKTKGDLAELKVACDLVERGYRVAIPFGEDSDFDLVCWKPDGPLERVQVKYARLKDGVIPVRTRSASLTNGKVKVIKRYTPRRSTGLRSLSRPPTAATTSMPRSSVEAGTNCTCESRRVGTTRRSGSDTQRTMRTR